MEQPPIARVLTADEWDAIPDTSGLELVDGMVHILAAATVRHEHAKTELRNVLKRLANRDYWVTTEIEVRLAPGHRRKPDAMVLLRDGLDLDGWLVSPEQVLLAAEVVSGGSETTDRKHKPIEYADAGIPHYWRVEIRPAIEVHTYRLGESGRYVETGLFTAGDRVSDPTLRWATFDVDELDLTD